MISILGWLGTALYLLNHAHISCVKEWNRQLYFSVNLVAGILLIAASVALNSWQAVVINVFWVMISLQCLCGLKLKPLFISVTLFRTVMLLFWGWIVVLWFVEGELSLTLLGWSSALVFSVAYLLFAFERISHGHYFLWNAYAALALLPELWVDGNLPVFVLEIFWALISIVGAELWFERHRLAN